MPIRRNENLSLFAKFATIKIMFVSINEIQFKATKTFSQN
jgi:hypothetical protein